MSEDQKLSPIVNDKQFDPPQSSATQYINMINESSSFKIQDYSATRSTP